MKIIKDPVHGYVEMPAAALPVLDSPALQRLRHIRQLGFAHLVYPGANHTRFEHSLGTMHLAVLMARHLGLGTDDEELVAIAALLHDVGHGPFSHTSEGIMRDVTGRSHHQVDGLLGGDAMAPVLDEVGVDGEEIARLIAGDHPLSPILHGDLDVDRMDYLLRDAHYTGVPYGTVDAQRLIRSSIDTGSGIALEEGGVHAAESLLIARTLMRPSIYFHHVSRIAASMFVLAAIEDLQARGESGEVLVAEDDGACFQRLLTSPSGTARDLTRRLYRRDLYKRAVYVGLDQVDAHALQQRLGPAGERIIADQVAAVAGVDPASVLVDIPRLPSTMSMGVRIRNRHALVQLEDVSPLARTLNETRRQQWRLGVYAPRDLRDVVGEAATEVMHIRRATKQDRLRV
ncbi:MAG: HD domain-containing protein [Methanomicrobiales archaeon]